MEHIGNKLGDDKYWFEIMEHSCNRSIAENPEKEGDFMQDGFLHCGTCKEPKREMYEWHGFKGSQWTGGEWKKVAETGDGTFFAGTPSRKYKCNRKFVINEDNSIGLTQCAGECIAEIRRGEFVDYTKICNLRG